MDIHTNIPLSNYTTMRLGGNARFMTDLLNADELPDLYKNAASQNVPIFILGGGSNTIARDEGYNGILVRNRIRGFDIVAEDTTSTTIKVGAGEIWDDIVAKTVEMKLSGIEAMSAIPGTMGAAPVQNIGAYGQEVAEVFVSLEAYDSYDNAFITMTTEDCAFGYRDSVFRSTGMGRYVILSVTLQLSKTSPTPPFYAALQTYLDQNDITLYTPQVIRDAVTAIRADKLPDPKLRPNSGSFFKNAIVEDWQLEDLRKTYPDVPSYEMADGNFKIPTGWLIDQLGFKGQLLHGMRVNDKNALVLINESAASYDDLAAARNEIVGAVRDTFHILIEQEPLELA